MLNISFRNTYHGEGGGGSKNLPPIGLLLIHPKLTLLEYFGVFDHDLNGIHLI